MKKLILRIGFVLPSILAAFLLGRNFAERSTNTEKTFKDISENSIFAKRHEHTPILFVYKKVIKNQPIYEKYGNSIVRGYPEKDSIIYSIHSLIVPAGYASSTDPINSNINKTDVDYLIKWDDLEGRFNTEESFFQNRHEMFSFFIAGS